MTAGQRATCDTPLEVFAGAAGVGQLQAVLGDRAWAQLDDALRRAADALAGRAIWAVNSTSVAGGVAELLRSWLPYWRAAGIDVVVKKSLEEGFGLGVTEAMWKRRAVVARAVEGHTDQIQDSVSGVLVRDPRDHARFGDAIATLLNDPARARKLGHAARCRVRERYLLDRHAVRWLALVASVTEPAAGSGRRVRQMSAVAARGGREHAR